MVIWKSRSRVTARQIVTPTFAASLLVTGVLSPWVPIMRWLLAAIVIAYSLPLLWFSAVAGARHGWRCGLALVVIFPALHFSHGLGFLKGALDGFVFRKRITAAKSGEISITR
jgi:hypothetical protein